jgi:hypothetical protein
MNVSNINNDVIFKILNYLNNYDSINFININKIFFNDLLYKYPFKNKILIKINILEYIKNIIY